METKQLSQKAYQEALRRWDAVAKPLGALGRFEEMIARIAAIEGTADVTLTPRCVVVFCADHGVVAQGVSQCGSDVTARVAASIVRGESNINRMAETADVQVRAVDMGMLSPVPGTLDCRQGRGTADLSLGPAMTRAQAECALQAGVSQAAELQRQGFRMLAAGEMGIGNTTAAAAMACALLGKPPEAVAGRGAGLSDDGLARKIESIRRALAVNRPDPADPVDVLAKVGGFELAGMAGLYLGSAVCGLPVVMDGMLSAVAALTACRICPGVRDFLLPSHESREAAGKMILEELGLSPVIRGDLALGEGTGAAMLFPLLDMAARVYQSSHTFDSLKMEAYRPQGGKP